METALHKMEIKMAVCFENVSKLPG